MIKTHLVECYDMNDQNDEEILKKDNQVYIFFEDQKQLLLTKDISIDVNGMQGKINKQKVKFISSK